MMSVQTVAVTAFQQNCAVLSCDATGEAAIVDPGGDLDKVLAVVEEKGVRVRMILLTHGHLDHAGAATELSERLGVQVIGPHEDDQFWLDGMPGQARMFGMGSGEVVMPDQYLVDGDKVSFGEVELEVLHCPGHTPGHVVFYEPTTNVAVVGDVLFQGSIGRTDFPRGNHNDLINAITTKLWPLGDDVTFLPGHGPISTFGAERQSNPFVGDAVLAGETD